MDKKISEKDRETLEWIGELASVCDLYIDRKSKEDYIDRLDDLKSAIEDAIINQWRKKI